MATEARDVSRWLIRFSITQLLSSSKSCLGSVHGDGRLQDYLAARRCRAAAALCDVASAKADHTSFDLKL